MLSDMDSKDRRRFVERKRSREFDSYIFSDHSGKYTNIRLSKYIKLIEYPIVMLAIHLLHLLNYYDSKAVQTHEPIKLST